MQDSNADNLHWVAASNGEVPPAALKVPLRLNNAIYCTQGSGMLRQQHTMLYSVM